MVCFKLFVHFYPEDVLFFLSHLTLNVVSFQIFLVTPPSTLPLLTLLSFPLTLSSFLFTILLTSPYPLETIGSCWAFSTTEGVMSAAKVQGYPEAFNLSPQVLVDCDKEDGGCDGGDLPSACMFLLFTTFNFYFPSSVVRVSFSTLLPLANFFALPHPTLTISIISFLTYYHTHLVSPAPLDIVMPRHLVLLTS